MKHETSISSVLGLLETVLVFSNFFSTLMLNTIKMQNDSRSAFVIRCAILYQLCSLKNVKNTYRRVLLLVKLVFSRF